MASLGTHWKRFLLVCSTQSHGSLHKSIGDWQRLTEMTHLLLRSCPPSRLAVLEHLTPLFVHYFRAWWAHNGHGKGSSSDNKTDVSEEELDNAGASLRELVSTLRQLVLSSCTPDTFAAALCSWTLARLRPVCLLPPTELLDDILDSLRSLADSDSHRDSKGSGLSTTGTTVISAVTSGRWKREYRKRDRHRRHRSTHAGPQVTNIKRVVGSNLESRRSASPSLQKLCDTSGGGGRAHIKSLTSISAASSSPRSSSSSPTRSSESSTSSSPGSLSPTASDAALSELEPDVVCHAPRQFSSALDGRSRLNGKGGNDDPVEDDLLPLDICETSPVNRKILGPWSTCPLLMDLLGLAYELIVGKLSCVSTLQMLITSATATGNKLPSPGSVLPHWILVWLVYQLAWQSSRSAKAGRRRSHVVTCILDAALRGPIDQLTALSMTVGPDTVAWRFATSAHIEPDFWISCCLTHLLFLGEDVTAAIGRWLLRSLDDLAAPPGVTRTGDGVDGDVFVDAVDDLVRVVLHLGLANAHLSIGASSHGGTDTFSIPPPVLPSNTTPGGGMVESVYRPSGKPDAGFVGGPPFQSQPFGGVPFLAPPMQPYSPLAVGGLCRLPGPPPSSGTGGVTNPFLTPPPALPFWSSAPPLPELETTASGQAVGFQKGQLHRASMPPISPYSSRRHHRRSHHPNQSQLTYSLNYPSSLQHMHRGSNPSASFVWLSVAAKGIRASTIGVLVDQLLPWPEVNSTTSKPPPQRLLKLVQRLTASSRATISDYYTYARMFTEMLLTAPDGCEVHRLLAYLLNWSTMDDMQIEDGGSEIKLLGLVCHQILSTCASTALCMVYTSTELPDETEHGGCLGILRAAEHLSGPPQVAASCFTSVCSSPRKLDQRQLLWYAAVRMDPRSTLPAGQLAVCLAATLLPHLAEQLLFDLCCAAALPSLVTTENSVSPLLLFYPTLDEFEAVWAARHPEGIRTRSVGHQCDSSYGHQLLAHRFLPSIWQAVDHWSMDSACALLDCLIWLLHREEAMAKHQQQLQEAPQRRRLLLALCCQLTDILLLADRVADMQTLDLLMSIYEKVVSDLNLLHPGQSSVLKSHTGGKRSPRYGRSAQQNQYTAINSIGCLPMRDCFSTGRRLSALFLRLLSQLEDQLEMVETVEKENHDGQGASFLLTLRLVHRIEHLLVGLSKNPRHRDLIAASAIQHLVEAIASQPRPDRYRQTASISSALLGLPSGCSKMDSPGYWRSIDADLDDITLRPLAYSHRGRKRVSDIPMDGMDALLLGNPPSKFSTKHGLLDDTLIRGRLREPVSSLRLSSGRNKKLPKTGGNVTATYFYCIHLLRQLIDSGAEHAELPANRSARLPRALSMSSPAGAGNPLLLTAGYCLETALLPHGAYLPQTSISSLPVPLALVLPPSGIGLERVLRLSQRFCSFVVATSNGHANSYSRDEGLLSAVLHLVLTPEETTGSIVETGTTDANIDCTDSSAPSPPIDQGLSSRCLSLPCHKLVLGLLMGLEAAWASPLAPRVSIPQALAFLTERSGRYAQGVFPIVVKPISIQLYDLQARRLAVDYSQRRVDCQSSLFRLTKQLVVSLLRIWQPDSSTQSAPPLDSLLDYLTPRELSIVLSDIRRNLRLRLGFSRLRKQQTSTVAAVPPDPSFISPGLLLAILHTHLVEPGVAALVGPLMGSLQSIELSAGGSINMGAPGGGDTMHREVGGGGDDQPQELIVLEEIDVDGELMVVVDD